MRSSRQGICKIYGEYNMEREGMASDEKKMNPCIFSRRSRMM